MQLRQGFFLNILKKTQGKKTPDLKKLKPNFCSKLNKTEVFYFIKKRKKIREKLKSKKKLKGLEKLLLNNFF